MRFLVTGGTGFVGRILTQALWQRGHVAAYTVNKVNLVFEGGPYFSVDVTTKNEIVAAVLEFKPDIVVHLAALTDADKCEDYPEVAYQINVKGTQNVVRACERTGSHLVFVSSSFVFSGEENPYQEDDDPEPINTYGFTKKRAEKAVDESKVKSTIIRTDQPYGLPELWQSETMVTWLLKKLAESNDSVVEVFADWYNTPILVTELCRYIVDLIEKDATGIYHVVGSEFISRYEWSRSIARTFGYSIERIEPVYSDSSNLPAKRPNAELSNDKTIKSVGWEPSSVEEALKNLVTSFSF